MEGSFYNLYEKLREDEKKFFNYFRMSIYTYNFLVELLENSIKHHDIQEISEIGTPAYELSSSMPTPTLTSCVKKA